MLSPPEHGAVPPPRTQSRRPPRPPEAALSFSFPSFHGYPKLSRPRGTNFPRASLPPASPPPLSFASGARRLERPCGGGRAARLRHDDRELSATHHPILCAPFFLPEPILHPLPSRTSAQQHRPFSPLLSSLSLAAFFSCFFCFSAPFSVPSFPRLFAPFSAHRAAPFRLFSHPAVPLRRRTRAAAPALVASTVSWSPPPPLPDSAAAHLRRTTPSPFRFSPSRCPTAALPVARVTSFAHTHARLPARGRASRGSLFCEAKNVARLPFLRGTERRAARRCVLWRFSLSLHMPHASSLSRPLSHFCGSFPSAARPPPALLSAHFPLSPLSLCSVAFFSSLAAPVSLVVRTCDTQTFLPRRLRDRRDPHA